MILIKRNFIILFSLLMLLSACKGAITEIDVTQTTTFQEDGKYFVQLGILVKETNKKQIQFQKVSIEGIIVNEQYLAYGVIDHTQSGYESKQIPSETPLEEGKLYHIILVSDNPDLLEFSKAYIEFNNYSIEYNR